MLNKAKMSVLRLANAVITTAAMVVYLIAPVATLLPQIAQAGAVLSITCGNVSVSGNTWTLSGTWDATDIAGQSPSQYDGAVFSPSGTLKDDSSKDSPDTFIVTESGHNFEGESNKNDAKGTWSNQVSFTSTPTGVFAALYHSQVPGNERSGDATCTFVLPPQCSDGLDNDSDGKTDYPTDPGCSSAGDNDETDPIVPPENTLQLCSDAQDNDGDTLVDLNDPDCAQFTPHLTVIKHVVNNNGGTAVAGNWTMNVTGTNVSNTGFPGAENPGTTVTLKNGAYSVDESGGSSGYAKSLGADCSGLIAVGGSKTCTITNDDIGGTLNIRKQTVGGFDTFGFTTTHQNQSNPGFNPSSFSLTTFINQPPAIQSFFDVFVDIYGIIENNLPVGWDQTGASCDNHDSVSAVHIGLGQNVTCTFENTKRGSITVHKNVVAPDGITDVSDSHEFSVTLDGENSQKFSETSSYKYDNLVPGIYIIAEYIGDPDFDLLRISNDNDDNAANGALVTVVAGVDTDVTITNKQKPGHLTVKKVVTNHGIGSAVSSDFTISVDGTNVSSTDFAGSEVGTVVALDPGIYSVGESGPDGYAMSQSSGCSGTMTSNGDVICTVTNSDIPEGEGAITVIKHVDNLHGGLLGAGDFTLYINGDLVTSGEANFLESDNDYEISENNPAYGYAQKSISCTNGDITTGGSVSLSEQEAWVCTITNEDVQPSLTVDKVVDDPKENYVPSFFDVFVDLEIVDIGDVNGFDAGEHTVTESLAGENSFPDGVGYTQSFGDACDEDGSVTLHVGDEPSTCIITNTITYAECTDGVDNDDDGQIDFGGANGDPSCSSAGDNNEHDTDETAPVSHFDSNHDHEVIDTELVQMSLTGQSTDNVGPAEEPKSGVSSASMSIYKLADAETMGADSFFDIEYREMSCQNLGGQVPIEIVALSLTSVEPLTVSWDPTHQSEHPLTNLERGVYCAVTHATDNAGNVEHTAIAGPFAYTFVPPTPTPTPPPSGGGGGGNGPIGGSGFAPSIPSQGGGGSPAGQVLGASLELPESCTPYLGEYIKLGRKNNSSEVKKLQTFLNSLGENLPVTGFYGPLSFAAVKHFQVKEAKEILTPWQLQTGSVDKAGTGYVYKTTKRWINLLNCPELNLPMPQLP